MIFLLLVQEHGGSGTQWLRFLTWTESFSSHTFDTVDPVVWSLVVELLFYALLPVLALALSQLAGPSRARATAILVALAAVSLLFRLYVTKWSTVTLLWRYTLPATFMFFVPGMLVALIRCGWERQPPPRRWPGLLRADTWILAAVALWLITCTDYDLLPLLVPAGLLLVGACVLPLHSGPVLRLLEWRPIAVLGIASYSLYLWHLPLIRAVAGAGASPYGFSGLLLRVAPLACFVSLLSYRIIEMPFLRLRRRWSPAGATQAGARGSEVVRSAPANPPGAGA